MAKTKLKNRYKYIIGIDEAGRGPLAGPVTVAAVATTANPKSQIPNSKIELRDSKKLTPKQRELWFQYITKELALPFAVASVSAEVIDKINISKAANLAASRALTKLVNSDAIASLLSRSLNKGVAKGEAKRKAGEAKAEVKVFLDGGLYINSKFKNQNPKLQSKNIKIKTIIKGDELAPVISMASIVAKVVRDKKMAEYHKKYPRYGFNQHKGYGTKQHIKAIKKFGLSPIHRRSFKIKI